VNQESTAELFVVQFLLVFVFTAWSLCCHVS